ncbi:MAG TPA: phosphopantothenoylcysteine decarboxylase [Phycisphaerae bacterium]|nr:phosphopantothenoylcysteine decarboxylase [Phycisphaerae bacterium]HOJ72921.1 phosphopantothenoylcysteine decarboxylase [Phycisphaerae bacterium]HOM50105.1 phosphopantothenoylcysteine decarboxylase [Phycisphaerae bacterium]HON65367.1 phosphopantothenoylcysteine decarboxylase [Phycisphaerae bacterium]HOQ86653.1 phosphopantothenoylcysteine decarboxylase [Phycisphaerae bacterium]
MTAARKRVLITAGPTHERIDDVRYLANRSSGRMGIALAEAASQIGCEVTLLLGPVSAEPRRPDSGSKPIRLERFESTADLERLLQEHFDYCDLLIMAAAVADYRPAAGASGKLPRKREKVTLELEPTPDLVATCAARRRPDQRIIAFALEESSRLHDRAIEKMRAKRVDAIVANPLETMGSRLVSAVIHTADGRTFKPEIPTLDKSAFAAWLIRWTLTQLG